MPRFAASIILALILNVFAIGQQSTLGWDLTYLSLLDRNRVEKDNWLRRWVHDYKTPAERWIMTWPGKPILSFVLIEHPAFHAGEHQTMWFVRTSDQAFYWQSTEGKAKDDSEEEIPIAAYDEMFRLAKSWQQFTPTPISETPKDYLPGYMGFLNVYGAADSKQMLLTMDDFMLCLDKTCMPGKLKSGRLFAAIMPIIAPEDPYTHKSEAQIAAMSPDERVDEEIKENDHGLAIDGSDKQLQIIQKYRRRDGLKGWQRIVELINSYQPKRPRDTRAFSAIMLAAQIDFYSVRLRASVEGRQIIDAVKRLADRLQSLDRSDEIVEIELKEMSGVNDADHAIQDTLWVNYRIKLADKNLLKFSNFLVSRDPTYPNWSDSHFIKDYSRVNDAGFPAQVRIMKNPARYYQLYLEFKRRKP
jgi:hypothetical protein